MNFVAVSPYSYDALVILQFFFFFFFSSRRRHTRLVSDWSSDVCSSDLIFPRSRMAAAAPSNNVPSNAGRYAAKSRQNSVSERWLSGGSMEKFSATTREIRSSRSRSEERRVGKECRARWSRDQ